MTAVFAIALTGFAADVAEVALKDLASRSDLIVVATVTKIEAGPTNIERLDPNMPPRKVATARVVETWKGEPLREVRYLASRSWICDTSTAVIGERVVLFLNRVKGTPFLEIAHAGCGRMPLREVNDKTYATLASEVNLPEGTPKISEEKTLKVNLPPIEPGKPAPKPLILTYTEDSIETKTLRGLVRSYRW